MPRLRTVLYVDHASSLGGACVSLRDMLAALDRERFRPVVGISRGDAAVLRLYEDAGVETVAWPGIETFEHTTAASTSLSRVTSWPLLVRSAATWRRSERRTIELVRHVAPDLVHLNSAVLVPSARALRRAAVPFVWHVREMPVDRDGLRTRALRRALRGWPTELLFLSERARDAWIGEPGGTVVPEFVDLARFAPSVDGGAARQRLGIAPSARVVLYAGGMSRIKGILPLLEALAAVRRRVPDVVCLMPGARPAAGPVVRAVTRIAPGATLTGRIARLLARGRLEDTCRRIDFASDMPDLVAASDLLVFPAVVDHFARPIAEAGAMEKPVVASRLPMIEEQVGDGGGAILVPPGDAGALADAMVALLRDPPRARALGASARTQVVRRFDVRRNAAAVMDLYERALGRARQRTGVL